MIQELRGQVRLAQTIAFALYGKFFRWHSAFWEKKSSIFQYSSGLPYIRKHRSVLQLCLCDIQGLNGTPTQRQNCINIDTNSAASILLHETFTTGNNPCSLREVRGNLKFILSEESTHIHDRQEDIKLGFYQSLDLPNRSKFILLTSIYSLKCQLVDLLWHFH